MTKTSEEIISYIVSKSNLVLQISEIGGREWYRKPEGGRKGPWLSAKYTVLDDVTWRRKGCCIYFVRDSSSILRYVGISLNKLNDRWRTSPAYCNKDTLLSGDELFHSQCWPKICEHAKAGNKDTYEVSTLSGFELIEILRTLDHELSHLSFLHKDPEIVVTVLELWICKYGYITLWNKALTGGKNARINRKNA